MYRPRKKVRKTEIRKAHAWAAQGVGPGEIAHRLNRHYSVVKKMLARPLPEAPITAAVLDDETKRIDEFAGTQAVQHEVLQCNLTDATKVRVLGLLLESRG